MVGVKSPGRLETSARRKIMPHRLCPEADYFQSVVAASPDCIRILTLDGRIEFVNPGGLKMLGITDFETRVKGHDWTSLWPQDQQASLDTAWRAALAGEIASFRGQLITPSGNAFWLDTVVSPVRDRQGEIVRIMATSRNVSDEVEARSLFDAILDCAPTALFAKEVDSGRIVFLNHTAEDLFGHKASVMVGRTADDFVLPEQAKAIRRADLEAAATNMTVVIEDEVITQNDGCTSVRRTRKRVTPPGPGPRYLVCSTEDVTAERDRSDALTRALAEAEAADQAKSQFLAVMSHEIRSPLNGVLGMAQAMDMGELPPHQRQRLQVIREAGSALLVLLNDLLDFSRINAGGLQLEDGVVYLLETARAAQNLFDGLAAEKDLSFELRIDPMARGAWRGDPTRIRQIVTNLVSNAVKFTDRGHVSLDIARNGDEIRIAVRDTGPGIPAPMLERIFDPFDQIDPSNTRRHGGSGLGLAICRSLAKLMGGAIAVESVVGEGSAFILTLPLERAAAPAPVQLDAHASPATADASLKILAAEDNPMNQLVLSTLLGAMGLQAHMVGNGQEAIDAWRRQPWDLILMDVQMPLVDGPTATRAIRAAEAAEGLAPTPIVALTANAMQHQLDEYAACGMDAVVSKPIEVRALMDAIHEQTRPRTRAMTAKAQRA
jgi:PAS domain S-box-containing protein